MKKFSKFFAIVAALVLGASFAGCAGGQDEGNPNPGPDTSVPSKPMEYPDYINDPDYDAGGQTTSNKYVVNVMSEGGLPLDNVSVALKDDDGTTLKTGVSQDGKIEFSVALGEYTLEVQESTLPAGYFLSGDEDYKTSPTSREEVDISISSAVFDGPAPDSYAVGDIMRDFTFTDYNGVNYSLAETLTKKKAVVLNFFYTTCNPCRLEFPAIQKAYNNYKDDIEFFGICYTGYGDNDNSLITFKNGLGITLPLGMDTQGFVRKFGVNAFPTTYIVDRYGLIAYESAGSEPNESTWNALFSDFTSANYKQDLQYTEGSGESTTEQQKPNVSMPASSEIEAALNDSSVNATYHEENSTGYIWPWVVGTDDGEPCVTSSNVNVDNSVSMLVGEFDMKKGDLLSFEYNINTETGLDLLYVIIDNDSKIPNGLSGNSNGWQNYDLYIADKDKRVEIIFTFIKDLADEDSVSEIVDSVKIRNLRISNSDDLDYSLDMLRPAADTPRPNGQRYENYVDVTATPDSDGFYHVGDETGPLLLITLDWYTPWSDLHMSSNTTEDGVDVYNNTLYEMTFFEYSNKAQDAELHVAIGDVTTVNGLNLTKVLQGYKVVSKLIDTNKKLMPVTEELKQWAQEFVKAKAAAQGRYTYTDEWLEFCYYYDHYGPDHDNCLVDTDFTEGLSMYNPYTAKLNTNTGTGEDILNQVYIDNPSSDVQRGDYYKFVAPQSGVYRIKSYNAEITDGMSQDEVALRTDVSQYLFIYDENGDLIGSGSDVTVRDYDVFTDENAEYSGFNNYLVLNAGDTVYLRMAVYFDASGIFDFEVKYMGEEYSTLLAATYARGVYSSDDNGSLKLDAVDVILYDGYYYIEKNGEPDMSKPIYIDMIYGSFFMSSFENSDGVSGNFHSVKWLYENGAFRPLGIIGQSNLATYLDEVERQQPEDPMYGFLPASAELVGLLQQMSMSTGDFSVTEGNDWLAFGVYMERFGL